MILYKHSESLLVNKILVLFWTAYFLLLRTQAFITAVPNSERLFPYFSSAKALLSNDRSEAATKQRPADTTVLSL
jgi:hypothetical protein